MHILRGGWRDVTRRCVKMRFCECYGKMERRYKWNILMRAEWYYFCDIWLRVLSTYAHCFDSVLRSIFSGVVGEMAWDDVGKWVFWVLWYDGTVYKWNVPVRAERSYFLSTWLHTLNAYARCFDSVLSCIFSGVVCKVSWDDVRKWGFGCYGMMARRYK